MIKLGVIGTGRIAGRFVPETNFVKDVQVVIAYNPRIESVRRFARELGIAGHTDQLDSMYDAVDAVYIASPHETHYAYAKTMLEHGKHVLCEKPLALQKSQAEELFVLAKEKGCVLQEAVKTAYCPGFHAMMQVAKSGVIGTIRDVEAGFTRLTPTNVREMTDEAYGGSFTELGSYTLLPVLKLFGTDYRDVFFRSVYDANGLDAYTKAFFEYEEGMGLGKVGLGVKSEGQLLISGTKGYILAESPWWLTRKFEVRYEDPNKSEVYAYPYEGAGLRYEIEAFVQAIDGREEANGLSARESIAMAGVMERFLIQRPQKKDLIKREAVKIWAHRGCSMRYPENTLQAFEAAAKLGGITGIELDVQLTGDGQVVVIHDENVKRTTNGTKEVREYTLQQIQELTIEMGNGKVTAVPTLREVLVLLAPYCYNEGVLINIELKNSIIRYEGMEEKVMELVREYRLEPYVVYSSFLPESILHVKKLDETAQTGVLCGSLEDCIRMAPDVKADALHPYIGGLHGCIPADMRHMPIRAWNGQEPLYGSGRIMGDEDLRDYAAYGVTDLFTNVPERYL